MINPSNDIPGFVWIGFVVVIRLLVMDPCCPFTDHLQIYLTGTVLHMAYPVQENNS